MGSQCYLHTCYPTRVNAPRLNPNQIGWYTIYLPRRDGKLSSPQQLVWWFTCPQTVTHPSTNRARRIIITSLIGHSALPVPVTNTIDSDNICGRYWGFDARTVDNWKRRIFLTFYSDSTTFLPVSFTAHNIDCEFHFAIYAVNRYRI